MTTILFISAGFIQLILLFVLIKQYKQSGSSYLAFPMLIVGALVADNWIVGFGSFIGEGNVLMFLNSIRFITHALFTSFGMIFAFGILKRIGVGFAQKNSVHIAVCIFAVLVTLLGIYMDVYKLQLGLIAEFGTIRYKNVGLAIPPIPAIITIIFFIIVGTIVWVKTKSPWMFLGSLIMFILAPLGFRIPILGNIGEIAFVGAMISGEKTAHKKERDR
jgi:hypothetical protein